MVPLVTSKWTLQLLYIVLVLGVNILVCEGMKAGCLIRDMKKINDCEQISEAGVYVCSS